VPELGQGSAESTDLVFDTLRNLEVEAARPHRGSSLAELQEARIIRHATLHRLLGAAGMAGVRL
jgi:hypothetical protein